MNTDLFTTAKALLDLIYALPDEQWAFTFSDYSAPEVQKLARAVNTQKSASSHVAKFLPNSGILLPNPNPIMFRPFSKHYRHFAELEVRKGITGGPYSVAKITLGCLPRKDREGVLALLNEIAANMHEVKG